MKDETEFWEALAGKKVPLLVLDPKWHRLFAIHGKTDQIKQLEKELNELLAEQGKLSSDLKDLKKLKKSLMESIVRNMEGANIELEDSVKSRKLEETSRLIDEINVQIPPYEDRLLELPYLLKQKNEQLMLASMDYCYEKMRVNEQEASQLTEWLKKVRIELKKNIIRKQNCELNSREIYAYMHDIFGPQVIDLFDIRYEEETEEGRKNQEITVRK